jgi:potassium-transporting ATPase KdpC subunit
MKTIWISIKLFLFLTILTGIIYPLTVTGIVQVTFPAKSNGSLIVQDDKVIGSELIGQQFDSIIYFTPRPSATLYNSLPSGGSNLGLTSTKLKNQVEKREADFITFNQLKSNEVVPSEMLFASASGLDPHISPQAALLQVDRIAKARNFDNDQRQQLIQIIHQQTETPQYFCLGEERVNVLLLNLRVDNLYSKNNVHVSW